jgi:hypothetical protein
MKSRIPAEEIGLWDLPTFSTVLHSSCSAALGLCLGSEGGLAKLMFSLKMAKQ